MSAERHPIRYCVYIIEITSRWHELVAPRLPHGRRCYYVGETGNRVDKRYREHRTGEARPGAAAKKSAAPFSMMLRANGGSPLLRKKDVQLRRTLMAKYEPLDNRNAAKELERDVIDELRADGHCVYPRDRARPHRYEFEHYRQTLRWPLVGPIGGQRGLDDL